LFADAIGDRPVQFGDLLQYPAKMRIKINRPKIEQVMGRRLAALIRARLRSGAQAGGSMPVPVRGGRPFNQSGRLIRSIKYQGGHVRATGRRKDGHKWSSRVQNRNHAILAIQVATRGIDPLGVSTKIEAEIARVAEAEIARQLSAGEGGLLAELAALK